MKQKKSLWQMAKNTITQWIEDRPFQLAAALSYYTLFSFAPLMIIAIAIAGFAFGREAAQNQIVETLQGMIGQDSAQAIQGMIQNASNKPKTGIISTVLGIIALIFGAGGVVGSYKLPSIPFGALRRNRVKASGALSINASSHLP
jgi:membrane protein